MTRNDYAGFKVLTGILLGVSVGTLYRCFPNAFNFIYLDIDLFQLLGLLFVNLIKMTIPVLLFPMIVSAFCSIKDTSFLSTIALKAVILFFFTTIMSSIIGICFAVFFKVGTHVTINNIMSAVSSASLSARVECDFSTSIKDMLINLVPTNAFGVFFKENMGQMVLLSIVFGIAINKRRKPDGIVVRWIESLSAVMQEMVKFIMLLAPIGVFGSVVWFVATSELQLIKSVLYLMLIIVLGMLFINYIFYGFMLLFARLNPIPFFIKCLSTQMIGMSIGSGFSVLPISINTATKKLGVSSESASVLMPIGSTINLNGTAFTLSMYTMFFINLYGIDFSHMEYIYLVVLSVIGAVATPPIAGGAVVTFSAIVVTLNLPAETIAVVLTVDKIISMLRVFVNVSGNNLAVVLVDKWSDRLSLFRYKTITKTAI